MEPTRSENMNPSTNVHEGRRQMYQDVSEYHEKFIDKRSGLLRADLLEARNCPVCDSAVPQQLFIKNGGSYVKCHSCSMCYLNPVFKDDELVRYYESNHAGQASVTANESDFYRKIYSQGLSTIQKFVSSEAILDIGCSSGFFLDVAKEYGWAKTFGIELNKSEFRLASDKNHIVWDRPIEQISFEEKFSAITLWDVFEHIKDGKTYLTHLKSLLKPDGLVFMQIPNFASLAARIMRAECNMFDGIEHVNLYSPSTILRLASICGFRLLEMYTVIDELHVVRNYLNYEDPYFGNAEKSVTPLKFLTADAIHQDLSGYKMQIVLKPE